MGVLAGSSRARQEEGVNPGWPVAAEAAVASSDH